MARTADASWPMPDEPTDIEAVGPSMHAQTSRCEPCNAEPDAAEVERRRRICKRWARGEECVDRGCVFRHVLLSPAEDRRARRAQLQRETMRKAEESAEDPYIRTAGAKARHGGRQREFAMWLVQTFGLQTLRAAHGVLDVAGGRAGLWFELHARLEVPCTVLEPRETILLRSHQRRLLRKKPHLPPMRHVAAYLGMGPATDGFESTAAGAALLAGCSVLVGVHCDEATEPLVRAAVRFGKPFAVVPCCVFARAHPFRTLQSGEPVRTYEQFCRYLLELAPGAESAHLPFEGRNRVIFRRSTHAQHIPRTLSLPRSTCAPSSSLSVQLVLQPITCAAASAEAGDSTSSGGVLGLSVCIRVR